MESTLVSMETDFIELNELDIKNELNQAWIETQNGLSATRVLIETNGSLDSLNTIKEVVRTLYHHSNFTWRVNYFCVNNEYGVTVYTFYKHWESSEQLQSLLNRTQYNSGAGSIKDIAVNLWRLENEFYFRKASPEEISKLDKLASHPSFTISTYAADILTKIGVPTVPSVISMLTQETIKHEKGEATTELMFEDKIDVCAYNFFEAVHPAYAKQTVVTAIFIERFRDQKELSGRFKFIDVGSGPGMPLLMLMEMEMEMMPELDAVAIEPSEIAYKYLKDNLALFNQRNVETICKDFLQFTETEKYPLRVSTGSSHHFNTHFFFQKAYQVLTESGVLIVADELVSKYESVRERKLNLIKHHTQYMLSILQEHLFDRPLSKNEEVLVNLFNTQLPAAAFEAQSNSLSLAEKICRSLLSDSLSSTLGLKISNQFLAFYRLMLLELEALVAGLDYQVEQKTYPERLIQIAALSGFSCIEHERVHSTHGHTKCGAGTHVFAFQKG